MTEILIRKPKNNSEPGFFYIRSRRCTVLKK